MAEYTEFQIEAIHDHTNFIVLVKGRFRWKSAFMATNYFSVGYQSEESAIEAIEKYKKRFIKA